MEGLSVATLSSNEVPHGMTSRAVGRLLGEGLVEASGKTNPVRGRCCGGSPQGVAVTSPRSEKSGQRNAPEPAQGWRQPLLFVEVE